MDGPGLAFEQVLDAKLSAHVASAPPRAAAVDARPDPGLRVAMLDTPTWTVTGRRGTAAFAACWPAENTPDPDFRVAAPPRPRRLLGAAGREALRHLRQWGAELPDDFTSDELKHAYRQLARQFHPDQHPTASAATRAALGGAFHQIHLAYRSLTQDLQPA